MLCCHLCVAWTGSYRFSHEPLSSLLGQQVPEAQLPARLGLGHDFSKLHHLWHLIESEKFVLFPLSSMLTNHLCGY